MGRKNDESFADEVEQEIPEAFRRIVPEGEDPGDFTFAAWLSGVRPTRRSETIYARLDLQAEIDRMAEMEIRATDGRGDEYRQRAIELTAELVASGIPFVLEARSAEWIQSFHDDLDKRGIKDESARIVEQIAAQVISPEGVTAEDLAALYEITPAQVTKLVQALVNVNTAVPVINPRFSRPSSGAPSGKGSLSR